MYKPTQDNCEYIKNIENKLRKIENSIEINGLTRLVTDNTQRNENVLITQYGKKPKILKTPNGIKVLSLEDSTARQILSNSKEERERGYEMLGQFENIEKEQKQMQETRRKKRWNKLLAIIGIKRK